MERIRRVAAGFLAGVMLAVLLPLGVVAAASPSLRPLRAADLSRGSSGEVYGFLPYWLATTATQRDLRFDLLSTVSLFSVGFAPDGSLAGGPGTAFVTGSRAAAITRAAHAAGVRVDLTFTSFGMAGNRALLRSGSASARAIRQAVALMAQRGADGATLDIEGLYLKDLPAFTNFVRAFVRAARVANPLARVAVTVGADQGGVLQAKAALAGGASRVVIMGYDYRSQGSATSGSIDPLVQRGGGISLTWTLDLYRAAHVPADQLTLALPTYGFSWPTTTSALGARPALGAYGRSPAYPIRVSRIATPGGVRTGYDAIEATAWMAVYDARAHVWRQTYWDTPRSLAAKFALARSRGLAGIGIWALGYATGSPGYWEAIAGAFSHGGPNGARGTAAISRAASGDGPTITSLQIAWDGRLRRWIVSYTAVERRATIVGYEVRYRIGQGPWQILFYQTRLRSMGLPVGRTSALTVAIQARDASGQLSAWSSLTP